MPGSECKLQKSPPDKGADPAFTAWYFKNGFESLSAKLRCKTVKVVQSQGEQRTRTCRGVFP